MPDSFKLTNPANPYSMRLSDDSPSFFTHSNCRRATFLIALRERAAVNYPHPIIAREAWPFVPISVVAAGAVPWFMPCSRVDAYLPLDATPKVAVGAKISANQTILAALQ